MMRARRLTLTVLGVLAGGLVFSSAPAPATTVHVFSGSFGSATSTPANPASLSAPSGVAVNDATEDVYVVDKGNNRVERFSATGTFIAAWGWGVINGKAEYQICTSTSGCQAGIEGSGAGQLDSPEAIAVDNSGKTVSEDPSVEDVYVTNAADKVIEKFSAAGKYEGELTGTCAKAGESPPSCVGSAFIAFSALRGVAVDPKGNVWVYNANTEGQGEAFEFNDLGTYLFGFPTGHEASPGIAVDSEDGLYLLKGTPNVEKFSSSGVALSAVTECGCATGVAIDQATNELLVDQGSSVADYGHFGGALAEEFGSGQLTSGSGIAVNSANDTVYVADSVANVVDSFAGVVLPDVTTGAPSNLHFAVVPQTGSATLNGAVNPLEGPLEDQAKSKAQGIEFEYGLNTLYELPPVVASPAEAAGNSQVAVTAEVSGLEPNTLYDYRVKATNATGLISHSPNATLTISVSPTVDDQLAEVTAVGRASAVFQGSTVNPENSDTFYHFAYVPAGEYQPGASNPYAGGGATADVNAGAGLVDETVEPVPAGDLLPGTTYHYALVAGNTAGSSIGEDHTFTTTPGIPPVATTGGASGVSQNAATLSGTVGTNSLQTDYGFEIGTEPGNYGPATGLGSLGGALTETVKVTLGELQPGTTYHYRITATNSDGASYGADQTFATPGFPVLLTAPAAPPLIATPAIAFPTETGTTTTTTTKALTRAQKLAAALKACKKKPKSKRASCQKQARQRYGPVKQKSKQK